MNKPLNPDRVRELRLSRKLSRKALAKKAGVSKETIYRLERGRQPGNRQSTQDGLMKAFGVELDVLTGDVPQSPTSVPEESADGGDRYQLNARVSGHVRNAFSLAARRYGVPIARIVDLAPFLFVLAAEGSLAWRRRELGELEARVHPWENLQENLPHLPKMLLMNFEVAEALEAEETSIAARDILADEHDAAKWDNPFVLYLKESQSHGCRRGFNPERRSPLSRLPRMPRRRFEAGRGGRRPGEQRRQRVRHVERDARRLVRRRCDRCPSCVVAREG